MTSWGVTLSSLALVLGAAACRAGDAAAPAPTTAGEHTTTTTSMAPGPPASTTTTMYAPDTVEGEVEAAYLKSWDVYAEAVYNLHLDEPALAEVYGNPLLSVRLNELADRATEHRAAFVLLQHDYRIEITGEGTAAVIDSYTNHQVLVDYQTKAPIEDDPNKVIVDVFTLRFANGRWMVFDQRRLS